MRKALWRKLFEAGRGFWSSLIGIAGAGLFLDLFAVLINLDWCLSGVLISGWGVALRLFLIAGLALALYRVRGWSDGYTLLVLFLLMLVSVQQYHSVERRMVADGFYYYS